ncbi:hypothetical protein CANCADRAFT_55324 [Tortispora caseinolytica NRRL Y-17796]|uniref:Uncharacterized protein n=1 Tax=Tortispora caseinolytica NRRL Y-17796 TaxID=767744 RepID=A0A1E4TI73_9ASCO|nr:hypothetical protein CANCADRAFT_55324 [Tortispora caseinolytica NRRL Y-17796]
MRGISDNDSGALQDVLGNPFQPIPSGAAYGIRSTIENESIDWTNEYAKDRKRNMELSEDTSFYGKLRYLLDYAAVLIVIIAAGLLTGFVESTIDIVVNWLGDIKTGTCNSGFYLAKTYCCWYEPSDACPSWTKWNQAIGVTSAFPAYIIDYFLYILFTIALSTTSALFVSYYAPAARGSGISEVKTVVSGYVIPDFMNFSTFMTKWIGLILAVSSGLWVGKEGPLVHIACCAANAFMNIMPYFYTSEIRRRNVFIAASAAGISAAFGAPIGGVLFSLEQIAYYSPESALWNSFVAAMIASLSLQAMNSYRTGKLVLFQASFTDMLWHGFEIGPFILLGILGGLFGTLFIRYNVRVNLWRRSSHIAQNPIREIAGLGLITAIVSYPIVFLRMENFVLLSKLFKECTASDTSPLCVADRHISTIVLLFLTIVIAFTLSVYSFGSGVPAGVILPSMTIGAAMGRLIGIIMEVWQKNFPNFFLFSSCAADGKCINPAVYALVGASAALSGITRMTVCIIVIMFELTGALTFVLPIMIGVLIAKWVADAFDKRNIYDQYITFLGYTVLPNRGDSVPDKAAENIMTPYDDLVKLTEEGTTINSLKTVIDTHTFSGFPIVNNYRDKVFQGYINRKMISKIIFDAELMRLDDDCPVSFSNNIHQNDGPRVFNAGKYLDASPLTFEPTTHFSVLEEITRSMGLKYTLIVSKSVLLGMVSRSDIWMLVDEYQSDDEDDNISLRTTRREVRRLLSSSGDSEVGSVIGYN